MTEQERILNRVKKMMNLANDAGATEGERDNALRMAYATLQKHNIDMASVEGHTIVGANGTQEKREKVRAEYVSHHWARVASMAVAELFFCSYYYSRDSRTGKVWHSFVGRTSNAVTAAEMSAYVCVSIQKEASRHAKWLGGAAQRDFCKGAVTKIVRRCYDMRREAEKAPAAQPGGSMALVLKSFYDSEAAANKQFLVTTGTKVVVKRAGDRDPKNYDAYRAGTQFGARVNLDRQIKGSN